MAATGSKARTQRGIALVVLLAAGVISLPMVAAFLDGPSTENLIIPVQLALMAVAGAIIGSLLPGLGNYASANARSAGFGALVGLGAALVGLVMFFLLLNGFSGA